VSIDATGSQVPLQFEKIRFLTDSKRLCPGRVPLSVFNLVLQLEVLQIRQLLIRSHAKVVPESVEIDHTFSAPGRLNLLVPAYIPIGWMLHYSRSNHVEIDVRNAPHQVRICLYRGGMIPVFPKRALAVFPAIEFLGGSPGHQLHGA